MPGVASFKFTTPPPHVAEQVKQIGSDGFGAIPDVVCLSVPPRIGATPSTPARMSK